jgi:uncharacterized protein (TIGR00730 family)
VTELRKIAVYCGSSPGHSPRYREAAATFGALLARRGIGIVYGGGCVGLMGAVADAAMAAGGEVTGVIPRFLKDREVGHDGVTVLHVVETMHERKAKMAALADAFVALPGGIGTLEELFEVWTWTQLGSQSKPVGLLDVDGFFAPLVAFVDHLVAQGFVRPEDRRILEVASTGDALLERFAAWQPPPLGKWMKPSQT